MSSDSAVVRVTPSPSASTIARPSLDRHEQHVRGHRVDDGGDGALQEVTGRLALDRHRHRAPRPARGADGQGGGALAGGDGGEELVLPGPEQQRGGDRGAEERDGRHGTAQLLGDDGDLAPRGARAAALLGHRQAGHADLLREPLPEVGVDRVLGVGAGEDGVPGRLLVDERADARPQVVLDVGVEEVAGGGRTSGKGGAHRGRSFHGTSLSARASAGRPSTRSAMTLRRISDVPPSMELARKRR